VCHNNIKGEIWLHIRMDKNINWKMNGQRGISEAVKAVSLVGG
jgi:hypothetical protein